MEAIKELWGDGWFGDSKRIPFLIRIILILLGLIILIYTFVNTPKSVEEVINFPQEIAYFVGLNNNKDTSTLHLNSGYKETEDLDFFFSQRDVFTEITVEPSIISYATSDGILLRICGWRTNNWPLCLKYRRIIETKKANFYHSVTEWEDNPRIEGSSVVIAYRKNYMSAIAALLGLVFFMPIAAYYLVLTLLRLPNLITWFRSKPKSKNWHD